MLVEERLGRHGRFAAFDVVINNADRKAGHVLEDRDGRLWAVDHGVTFHVEPKLRTVIWEFAEEPLPEPIKAQLEALLGRLRPGEEAFETLAALLSAAEAEATAARVEALLRDGRFPPPTSARPLPWPLI